MGEIIIKNLGGKTVPVAERQRLLDALQGAGIDWMHACGGKGRCTTCAMQVLAGQELLSPQSPAEKGYQEAGRLGKNERLACQCVAKGTIEIRVPERYQFPHMNYHEA